MEWGSRSSSVRRHQRDRALLAIIEGKPNVLLAENRLQFLAAPRHDEQVPLLLQFVFDVIEEVRAV
jgi:hypothetical protein